MKRLSRTGRRTLLGLVFVVLGLAAFACAQSYERRSLLESTGDAEPPSSAEESDAAPGQEAPAPPAAPEDPLAGITGDPAVGFAGEERLLVAALGTDVSVPALEVACVGGDDALSAPAVLDARLEAVAAEQGVSLGRVRFVRLESDPSRAPPGAPPRLCRPVMADAKLHAPLFREKESGATWLVEEPAAGVPAATRRLLERAAKAGAKAAAPPRVLVVRGEGVAVALPILVED